jgi:ribosomal protein S18 acetylase RimI-like enzyme
MTVDVTVRPYEHSDRAGVIDLWRRTFPDDPPWNEPEDVIERKALVQGDLFLVATVADQLAGTVLAGFDGVRGWIHKLAVDPAHRRSGVARRLMEVAETGLRDRGCPKVNLQVRASNAAVTEFYRRAGYAIEDRISMGKRL